MKLEPVAWTMKVVAENPTNYQNPPMWPRKDGNFCVPLYAIPPGYVVVPVEPSDKEFEALFEAYNKDYHGSDQMQDIIDRILALRRITVTAQGEQ